MKAGAVNYTKIFSESIVQKIQAIEKKGLLGISLMGSYSRNEAGKYSDIDIVCFSNVKKKKIEVSIIDSKYLVISYVEIKEVENWFTHPELITELLYGLTKMVIIWDSNHYLKNLKQRANNFQWNDDLQIKANQYTNRELSLLLEEVNKGIQGLISNDVGRQLNSLFGLSFSLTKIIRVQKGILIQGDNTQYYQILSTYKNHPKIVNLIKVVYGEIPKKLTLRVKHGLILFQEITEEFKDVLEDETHEMIKQINKGIVEIII